jgi:hypothetical protein
MEHLAGAGSGREEQVIAEDLGVTEARPLLVLSRHLTDSRVDVDDETRRFRTAPIAQVRRKSWLSRPRVGDVAETEGAEKRAER